MQQTTPPLLSAVQPGLGDASPPPSIHLLLIQPLLRPYLHHPALFLPTPPLTPSSSTLSPIHLLPPSRVQPGLRGCVSSGK